MNRIATSLATAAAVLVATAATARIAAAQHAPAPPPPRGIVRPVGVRAPPGVTAASSQPGACALVAVAAQGQVVAGAGALQTQAWGNPACLARTGAMAFVAGIAGGRSANARGVFVADAAGVRAIAIGCGNGGGAPGPGGDPAPGGGTLAGLFTGTAFAPAIDSDGNVVFLADLAGAPAPRALFGWVAAQQALVRIAAVGDAAPGGGTFAAVGPGVIADGAVAFAARTGPPGGGADLFWWRAGTVRRLVAVGDALPGGGTIAALATESMLFPDGSDVPIGPLPALDECGRAAFRAIGANGGGAGGATSCIVVRSDLQAGGADSVWLRTGDAAPAGGTFAAFDAPLLAGGSLAVFADVALGSGATTAGWFVGSPGAFRRALAFFDAVDGGRCLGLAVSRAGVQALDERGGLALWCDLALSGGQDRIVESLADGSLRVLARRGDPSPLGVLGTLNAWPARSAAGRTVVSAAIPGGSAADAHFVAVACGPLLAAAPCARIGGTTHVVDHGPPGGWFALAASPSATDQPLPPWGTLRIGPTPIFVLELAPYAGFAAPHVARLAVPDDQSLLGAAFHFQSLALGVPDDRLTDSATIQLR